MARDALGWAAAAGAAALWGAADPLLRRAAAGGPRAGGGARGLASAAGALGMGVNLAGTALFYVAVARAPLAAAGPVVNGLALALTAVVAHLLGEPVRLATVAPGVALVAVGAVLCASGSGV